jgi:hypothetical protein
MPEPIRVTVHPDGSHTGQVIVTHPRRNDVLVLCPLGHYWTSGQLGAMHGSGEWIIGRAGYPWVVTCHGTLPPELRPGPVQLTLEATDG